MARQKKESINLNMRVNAEVMRRFNEYCERMGQTKTLAFERIITTYLDELDESKKEKTDNSAE